MSLPNPRTVPDFSAAFASGVTLEPWVDPPSADGTRPSRANTNSQHPHRRRVGAPGTQITVQATVAGLGTAPLDSALDGRTFLAWLVEWPGQDMPPGIATPAGQSSLVRFTPARAGHHTLVMRRAGGGGVFLHVDVVAT